MYLLDTDILSNLMKRSPSTSLIAKLASVPVEQQFTSSITLGELVYGAYRLAARTDALLARLEATLLPNLPILPFDAAAAYQYGEVRAQLERQGTPWGRQTSVLPPLRWRMGLPSLLGMFDISRECQGRL